MRKWLPQVLNRIFKELRQLGEPNKYIWAPVLNQTPLAQKPAVSDQKRLKDKGSELMFAAFGAPCWSWYHPGMKRSPGALSRLFFLWVGPFIARNTAQPLEMESLLAAPASFDASLQLSALKESMTSIRSGPLFLARALIHSLRREIARTVLYAFVLLLSGLATPLVLREFLRALEGKVTPWGWIEAPAELAGMSPGSAVAFSCALVLFALAVTSTLAVHHLFYIQVGMSIKGHSALRALIYEKAMRLARSERGEAPSGAVITLAGTDSGRILSWLQFLHAIWYHPLQVTLALVLLYRMVGVAAVFGTLSLIIPLIIASALVRAQNRLRREILRITDQRVGFTAEVLGHIKTVKFQAWERPLADRILELRSQELRHLRRVNLLSSFAGLASNLSPALAMLITFSVLVSQGGALDAAVVFPSMSIILLLRFALNSFPDTIMNTMEALISASRIQVFLNRDEFQPRYPVPSQAEAVRISDATIEWSPGELALKVENLRVMPGELVAIVGGVGSGKSALLLAILGELNAVQGDISTSGSLGYVAQQPWIVSDTIRNNILAGQPFDHDRYRRAILAASLDADLPLFPQGDATLIGERGVNLSGGQRQRVALARALYARSAIYLLDDPLSALDPTVANEVFERLILGELAGRARILVTHRLEYALRADRVVVIEGGSVVESGSPAELRSRNARFAALLGFHDEMTGADEIRASDSPLSVEAGEKLQNQESDSFPQAVGGTLSVVEAEERDVGAVNRAVVSRYARCFMPGLIAPLLIAVVLLRHVASVSSDLWLASFSQGPVTSYFTFIAGYGALLVVLAVLQFSRWYLFLGCGLRAGQDSHARLLRGVLAAPLRFFESNPVGRIVNRFSRDLDTIEGALPRTLQDSCHCLLDVAVVFIMIAVLEPWALLVLLPISLMYLRMLRLFRPTAREAQRLESIARSPVFALYTESLGGVDTLRASGITKQFECRLARYLNTHSDAAFTLLASNRWLGIRLELMAALVLLAAGTLASVFPGSAVSPAIAGLLLTYTITFTGAMNWMIRSFVMAESNLTSFERMEFYAATPSESRGGVAAPEHWPTKGELRPESLTIRYRPELPPALDRLTCTLPAGRRVGIVGRTGSGKSTLILALGRLLEPTSGHVELDGINTSSLSLEALRSALTVVPQEPVLFSGPLRDTLDPFRASTDSDILEALRRVELERFVAELPGGLQAVVHEGGANFSCGQRQLLCLARALLRESKVIVLDEATANIDVETDYAIQRTIRREFGGATVLVVAHRLGTVIDSDLMLVLEGGRLAEFGPPEELLTASGSVLSTFVREMQRGAA